jgi:hypothetical protein
MKYIYTCIETIFSWPNYIPSYLDKYLTITLANVYNSNLDMHLMESVVFMSACQTIRTVML